MSKLHGNQQGNSIRKCCCSCLRGNLHAYDNSVGQEPCIGEVVYDQTKVSTFVNFEVDCLLTRLLTLRTPEHGSYIFRYTICYLKVYRYNDPKPLIKCMPPSSVLALYICMGIS